MKYLSYLFTAAFLFSTSPLIAMNASEEDVSSAAPLQRHLTSSIRLLTPDLWGYAFFYIDNPGAIFGSHPRLHQPVLKNVRRIKSSKLSDEVLSDWSPHLQNLRSLDLIKNDIITSDGNFPLTGLTSLNLTGACNVYDEFLSPLTNLTQLTLGRASRIGSADIICELPKLTWLDLSENLFFPENLLSCLTNLTNLKMPYNQQIKGCGLSPLTNLRSLNVSYCPHITSESLSHLTNLTELEFARNINKIPYLPNLTSLNGVNLK